MGRQVIIISSGLGPGGDLELGGVYWLTTPATMVRADSTRKSLASNISPNPTTSAELLAIQNGTVTEQYWKFQVPSGATAAQVEAALQNAFASAQTALNVQAPGHNYTGTYWDGTTWTIV